MKITFTKVEWAMIAACAVILCFLLAGCTQGQVDRAQVALDQAKEVLAESRAAEARVAEAVATARQIADKIGSDEGKALVEKAESALAMAKAGVEKGEKLVNIGQVGLDAAKASQAAGGSTLDLLLSAAAAFIPGAGVAAVALRSALNSGRALRQTVSGISDVREAVGEAKWKTEIAPFLCAAHDESVKKQIAAIEAKLP
jgi:hypothetical protein